MFYLARENIKNGRKKIRIQTDGIQKRGGIQTIISSEVGVLSNEEILGKLETKEEQQRNKRQISYVFSEQSDLGS